MRSLTKSNLKRNGIEKGDTKNNQNRRNKIMKFRVTQKEIKANFEKIISVPYCSLQILLCWESPVAYTTRRVGWAADIYDIGGGVAIVTGYAPFGNIRPSYELVMQYEKQAESIRYNYSLSWTEQREQLKQLTKEFIAEASK